jgi:hypothetical protein
MPYKPRQIGEKQASSEIAQSRERFEKWSKSTAHAEPDETKRDDIGHYKYSDVAYGWKAWQAAERYTRQLVAQELETEAKRLYATGIGSLMDGSATLENMAERIRGKE